MACLCTRPACPSCFFRLRSSLLPIVVFGVPLIPPAPPLLQVFCVGPVRPTAPHPRAVLIRVAASEEDIIDRTAELRTFLAAATAGICATPLLVFSNGRVEHWLEGYAALTAPGLRDPCTSVHIAQALAAFHHSMVCGMKCTGSSAVLPAFLHNHTP